MTGLDLLVVEDEPLILSVVAEYMATLGHRVCVAQTGRRAMRLIDQADFDLVILDWHLPGVTGKDVLQHLRKCAPETAVIVVTGGEFEAPAGGALRADVVPKPYSLRVLAGHVERLCPPLRVAAGGG